MKTEKLSEIFSRFGDECREDAIKPASLKFAFFGAAVALPFSPHLAAIIAAGPAWMTGIGLASQGAARSLDKLAASPRAD